MGTDRVSQEAEEAAGRSWSRVFILDFMGRNAPGRVGKLSKFKIGKLE